MNPHSAIYVGSVRHARYEPRPHAFRYRVFLVYLDLEEAPHAFDGSWLWGYEKARPASYRRRDYLGDPSRPLIEAVREVVFERLGRRPAGGVRMLSHLRYFGYCFNPVTFYYCFDGAGSLDAIVAEITNTPWGERYAYVLDAKAAPRRGAYLHFGLDKTFHVSPFLDMDYRYDWRFREPGERLAVHMKNIKRNRRVFTATLTLERRPWNAASLARVLANYPLMTAKVSAAIYFQALRLWAKRTPFHSHPKHLGVQEHP